MRRHGQVVENAGAATTLAHRVRAPQLGELRTVRGQFTDKAGQGRVAGIAAGDQPQVGDGGPGPCPASPRTTRAGGGPGHATQNKVNEVVPTLRVLQYSFTRTTTLGAAAAALRRAALALRRETSVAQTEQTSETRLAYSEIHADERDATSAAFLHRVLAWFAGQGIRVRRVLTDNAMVYRTALTGAGSAQPGSSNAASPNRLPQDQR
jgi:hypothetical protein